MSAARRFVPWLASVGLAAVVVVAACSSSDSSANCKSRFNTGPGGTSSPAPGFLTLNGTFVPDETITLSWTDDAGVQRASTGSVTSARSVLTFTGMPSGTRTFRISVSCANGSDDSVAFSATVLGS